MIACILNYNEQQWWIEDKFLAFTQKSNRLFTALDLMRSKKSSEINCQCAYLQFTQDCLASREKIWTTDEKTFGDHWSRVMSRETMMLLSITVSIVTVPISHFLGSYGH